MIQHFWMFAVMALLLNLTPGNDMLYVMARSSGQGTKAGIISALGIMAGCMVHIFAAVIGLSALIAESALAFAIVKYAGIAYLVYLGIKSLIKKTKLQSPDSIIPLSYPRIFWQGVLTNVLNPKVALFFLAFLPQFISISFRPTWLPIILLGTWFDVGGTVVNIGVALLFGKVGALLNRSPGYAKWQQKITGMLLIALGIKLAFSSKK